LSCDLSLPTSMYTHTSFGRFLYKIDVTNASTITAQLWLPGHPRTWPWFRVQGSLVSCCVSSTLYRQPKSAPARLVSLPLRG